MLAQESIAPGAAFLYLYHKAGSQGNESPRQGGNAMCQMRVVLEKEGEQEMILDNASLLEVTDDGVSVSALFEPPRVVPHAMVARIDFMSGTVTLATRKDR